ncbi:MAG: hypothetical protein OEV08_11830, partial [Nitrospira sp.]|nr:hypothetical protein [Nitrospira sp.]
MARRLFRLSEARGKDAAGILAVTDDEVFVCKTPERARRFARRPVFAQVLNQAAAQFRRGGAFVVAGHTRMVTNGSEDNADNNQPVIVGDVVLLHNGIIVNAAALWQQHPELRRAYEVDTEVFGALVASRMAKGDSFEAAIRMAFAKSRGANTIMALHAKQPELLLGTTNGSLFCCVLPEVGLTLFGSEAYILVRALTLVRAQGRNQAVVEPITRGTLLAISLA